MAFIFMLKMYLWGYLKDTECHKTVCWYQYINIPIRTPLKNVFNVIKSDLNSFETPVTGKSMTSMTVMFLKGFLNLPTEAWVLVLMATMRLTISMRTAVPVIGMMYSS